jgi:peptide/nickel transport system permease protein
MALASLGIWTRIERGRRNPALAAGLAMLALVVLVALMAPLLVNPRDARLGAFAPGRRPSGEHMFGTDTQGRDVLAVLVLATPATLKIGLIAGTVGLSTGTLLGLMSGYFGGAVDGVIRTAADVLTTIPGVAVLVLVATYIKTMTVELMALIVASLAWIYPTRAIRAQTLTLRERAYVQVARLNGVGGVELVLREILPNLLPYLAASFVAAVSNAIVATIGLEALGLGPQNSFTLGMMIYWGQFYGAILRGMWWWWGPPILLILVIFVGLLLTSAGLDQIVNTRTRRTA